MKLTFHSTIQQVWGNGEAAIVTAPSTLALYCMKVLRSWFEQQIQRDDDKVQEAQRQSATLAKAVDEEIRLVNEKITAVEEEIRLAKASNDKEEVQDLRKEKEQLRKEKEQLRKEKEILLMREVGPS